MSKLRLTLLLLAPFVLATIVVTTAALLSILSPVVTSSPLEDIIDDEYSLNTTNGTGVAAVRDLLQDWFHTSFEQGWRNSSMMEFQPETSSQDAQEALFNTNDLVFVATNGPLSPPATKISSNSSAQHFGVVVFPIIASSLVVIHSSKAREDLVLNAELLKDILIGKITHWADKRIAQLNPQSAKQLLSSKNDTIKVFLPIEMSLTSHPLIKFLASSNINSNDAAAAHEISVAIRSAASPITLIKTGAALPSYLSDVPNAFGIVDASFIHTSYSLDNVFKAKILNSKGKAVLPTGSNGIVAAMQNTATTITASVALHENTPLIIDASDEHAYPLSTLFYISLRKDYLVNATQSSEYIDGFCDKVRRLVWFWKESLEKRKQEPFLTFDISLGFVPLSDELSASALQALGLITCNERNMIESIEKKIESQEFYADNLTLYTWRNSPMFWKNLNSSFHNAPSGSTIYIVFCVILIFSSTLLVLSKLIHLRHIKDADIATMKQDVKDKKRQLKLSPQNGLAIISVSLTFLQYCSLLFQSSLLPMEAKISGKLALYMGLVPPSVTYLVFLKALVTLWLIGIYYLVVVRPRILKNPSTTTKSFCPHTTTSALLNRLEPWDEFLVLYLPNFASIGFTPVVDLLLRTFDCRERREAAEYNSNFEKPFMGNDGFISSFSTGDSYFHCYTPTHYFMSLFAFVLTPLFVLAVLRYSKIFKAYRKKFDFHDKAAFVFLEPFGKLVLVVAFYNIPITFFYGLCSLLAFMTCLLLIIWQPNVYRFYDWTRAVLYGVVGILSGFFLSVELFVHEEDYSLRRRLAGYVSNVIVAFEMAIVVSVLIVFYRNLEKRDSENEAKHRKEVEDLFNAISGDHILKRGSRMKHITRNSTTKQTQEKYGDVSSSSLPPVSLQMLHQRVASFPWMEARHMIVLAEQTGMIENKVARAVLNEIEFGDGRILIHLFERAEGRFDCFLDLLSLKVYQIIGDYGEDDDSDERSLISQSSEF